MRRRDWLLSACGFAAGLGCRWGSTPSRGDIEALAGRLQALEGSPTVVFLWAPWSRSAIQLESTMVELQDEYEPFGVEFIAVLLDSEVAPEEFDLPCFFLEGGALYAFERFGVSETPAVLTISRDGRLSHRLQPSESGGRIEPADIADAIEAIALEK